MPHLDSTLVPGVFFFFLKLSHTSAQHKIHSGSYVLFENAAQRSFDEDQKEGVAGI